jgi:hypothetical protein
MVERKNSMKNLGLAAFDMFVDNTAYRELRRIEETQRNLMRAIEPPDLLSEHREHLRCLCQSGTLPVKTSRGRRDEAARSHHTLESPNRGIPQRVAASAHSRILK